MIKQENKMDEMPSIDFKSYNFKHTRDDSIEKLIETAKYRRTLYEARLVAYRKIYNNAQEEKKEYWNTQIKKMEENIDECNDAILDRQEVLLRNQKSDVEVKKEEVYQKVKNDYDLIIKENEETKNAFEEIFNKDYYRNQFDENNMEKYTKITNELKDKIDNDKKIYSEINEELDKLTKPVQQENEKKEEIDEGSFSVKFDSRDGTYQLINGEKLLGFKSPSKKSFLSQRIFAKKLDKKKGKFIDLDIYKLLKQYDETSNTNLAEEYKDSIVNNKKLGFDINYDLKYLDNVKTISLLRKSQIEKKAEIAENLGIANVRKEVRNNTSIRKRISLVTASVLFGLGMSVAGVEKNLLSDAKNIENVNNSNNQEFNDNNSNNPWVVQDEAEKSNDILNKEEQEKIINKAKKSVENKNIKDENER